MALEQYFTHEWKPFAGRATSDGLNGCFDCNICLDFAHEPVVTHCGHLYCWPCIYKWLHVQSASLASDKPPQCPVCKAEISHTTMVPLYGRGQSESEPEAKAHSKGMVVPPRPRPHCNQPLVSTASQNGQQLPYRNPYQTQNRPHPYVEDNSTSPVVNLNGMTMTGTVNPMVGLFGEMVYARVFGNSESVYGYRNTHPMTVTPTTTPRLRRQEMQANKSLNRVSIFLFCCFLLCLIVF